jgi:hypothetical protein
MRSAATVAGPAPARAVHVTTGISVLAGCFGLLVVGLADGWATWFVLASCVGTFLAPVAIRLWGGRAPDDDALFVRILMSLSIYLVPMAVFQAHFAS